MKLLVFLLLFSSFSYGLDKVEKVSEVKSGSMTKVILALSSDLSQNPQIQHKKEAIHIFVPGVESKGASVHLSPANGMKIIDSKDGAILVVPRSSIDKKMASSISVKLSKKSLTAILPLVGKIAAKTEKVAEKKPMAQEKKVEVPKKSNLDYLIEDFRRTADTQDKIPFNEDKVSELLEDKITTKQTAQVKTEAAPIVKPVKIDDLKDETKGIQSYLVKLVIVLGTIVGGFLLVMNLFRKKVLGKSKLGFLNNSKLVEVIGTTHIAPKKNLLLVRVHDQYLLLSNTETGINFLTEVKDQAGLLKMGEKEVLGNNFDGSLKETETSRIPEVVEKKDIYKSTPTTSRQASFSKHLKKKMKKPGSIISRA